MTIHKILPKVVYETTDVCVEHLDSFEKEIKLLEDRSNTTPHFQVK